MSLHERKVVSVFGSALLAPDTLEYARARRVGQLLAEAGCIVVTGGYGGLMAAVCQGAREAGGHTVGVTLPQWGLTANPWVCEERPQASYVERVSHVTTRADAYVALDGGVGTLTELALTWSMLQTGAVPPRPLVAMGRRWRQLFAVFASELILRPHELGLVALVDTPEEVVAALREGWGRQTEERRTPAG